MKYFFIFLFVLGFVKTSVFSQSVIIWKFFDGKFIAKNVTSEGGRIMWNYLQTPNVNIGIDEANGNYDIVLTAKDLYQISINNNEIILSEDDFSKGVKDKILYKLTATKCYYKKQIEKNWVLFREGNFYDGNGLTNPNIKYNTDVIESYNKSNYSTTVTNYNLTKNKVMVSKTKPKKFPITRTCECCGIVFTIKNGWGYSQNVDETIFKFGSPSEQALEYMTEQISKQIGMVNNEYHSYIKFHSYKCANDCGN